MSAQHRQSNDPRIDMQIINHPVRQRSIACLATLVALVALASCGGNPARVELGVDLYLHPDSASPDDVLLQAAIARRIGETGALDGEAIHVRAFEGVVFLSGNARDACASGAAERIASTTAVTVEGSTGAVRATRVENHIESPEGVCISW